MTEERRSTDPFKDDLREMIHSISSIKESLVRIEEKMIKVDDHHKTLYGTNGNPGLTIVVDRLDTSEMSRKRTSIVAWTAFSGILIKSIWDMVVGKQP